jgi:hypothetical protein
MLKLSDILSISRQYEKMFAQEMRVQIALSDLYDEVYLFLEKIRLAVTSSCESSRTERSLASSDFVI